MRKGRRTYKIHRRKLLDALFILHPHKCVYCLSILTKETATIDHKIPISKGGLGAHLDNLQLTCSKCNNEKDKLTHEDYLMRKFGRKEDNNPI